ncbi:MAG: hypothetical protein FWD38_00985 [Oscillospiraceae bacterium]|nr:hypothetical protein [Oscillospiraceae bacterium]
MSKKANYINRIIAVVIVLFLFTVFAQRTLRHHRDILRTIGNSIGAFFNSEEPFLKRTGSLYMDIHGNIQGSVWYFYSYPPRERSFINAHYEYIKLTGRGHFNGITFLNDGRHMLDRLKPMLYLHERTDSFLGFKNYLADKGTPFLYVRVPNKLRDNSQLPRAFADNHIIENGDKLLELVSNAGMDTFDLRAEMMRDNLSFKDSFYHRHMHWTNKTVLWASQKVGALMNAEYGFNIDLSVWDPDKYEHAFYERMLLGNEAIPVGAYSDLEDITLLFPNFPVDFEVSNSSMGFQVASSDNFVEIFLPTIYRGELTHFECHDIRIFGAHFTHIINHAATEDKRVLLLSDSYSLSWAMYLPLGIKNFDFLYLINHTTPADMWGLIEDKQYDLVILAASDVMVSTETASVFEDDRLYLGTPPVR